MKITNMTNLRKELKENLDVAAKGENVVVMRPKGGNVVIISEKEYKEYKKLK